MTATISDSLRHAGRKIASTEEHGLAAALNAALDSVLPEFYVGPGIVVDADGARSGEFSSLVATEAPDADGAVHADAVAVAVYACKNLDASSLADGYKQIAAVRRLRKTPSAVDSQTTNTLGLIVAARTDLSLDEVAKEMRELNHGVEDDWRPDMAAIFAQGVVSYGMSFFDEPAVGAYLQPKAGTRLAPPINVHLIVTETETDALNKLCGLLSGHLAFFAPSVPRPDMRSVLDGAPQNAAIAWTYQYDVARKLADARAVESDAPAYRIEDPRGTPLCRLRFQRWQDGGIIVAEGGLPLSGLLALTGKGFPTTTFPRAGGRQLSCVLPIVERDFVELMGTISKRSTGMVVRAELPQFAIVKLLDEGTSTPFVARLYMTPSTIRDAAFTSKDEIAEYDKLFQFMLNHLVDVRKTAQAIVSLWTTYAARVASGEIARYDNALHIDEPIDQPLNAHVKSFVLDAARAAKKMQHLIGVPISEGQAVQQRTGGIEGHRSYSRRLPEREPKVAATSSTLARRTRTRHRRPEDDPPRKGGRRNDLGKGTHPPRHGADRVRPLCRKPPGPLRRRDPHVGVPADAARADDDHRDSLGCARSRQGREIQDDARRVAGTAVAVVLFGGGFRGRIDASSL
jgi:hypothetical protein